MIDFVYKFQVRFLAYVIKYSIHQGYDNVQLYCRKKLFLKLLTYKLRKLFCFDTDVVAQTTEVQTTDVVEMCF